jgi:hypothetical protein
MIFEFFQGNNDLQNRRGKQFLLLHWKHSEGFHQTVMCSDIAKERIVSSMKLRMKPQKFQYSCENEISRSRQKRWISRKWWWIYQRNLTILPQEYSQWKVTSHLIELILYKWQRRINTLCIKFKIRTYNIFFYNKAHPVSDIWYKRAGILLTWARECMTASFH